MAYWLLKTEPGEWSWEDQSSSSGISNWDGVRNAQAQKLMKSMNKDDLCLFYHSGKAKEVVGLVKVVKTCYPDASDSSGKCGMVDVQEVCTFKVPVTLTQLKQEESIRDFVLFRQPRLSVVPVRKEIFEKICELGGLDGAELSQGLVRTVVKEDSREEVVANGGMAEKEQKRQKKRKRKIETAASEDGEEVVIVNGGMVEKKQRMQKKRKRPAQAAAIEDGEDKVFANGGMARGGQKKQKKTKRKAN